MLPSSSSLLLNIPPISKHCSSCNSLYQHGWLTPFEIPSSLSPMTLVRSSAINIITMRNRSKNRKPTQRGRYLSIEAIHAIQALKRTVNMDSIDSVMKSKVLRLIKGDLVAVLREFLNQNEGFLALKVFEEVRKEHWYKAELSVYTDLINVLAANDMHEEVKKVASYLKTECLYADTESYNLLFKTLLKFGYVHLAVDCFRLMKLWECDPDDLTYEILINGLESNENFDLSTSIRQEAQYHFGRNFFEVCNIESTVEEIA